MYWETPAREGWSAKINAGASISQTAHQLAMIESSSESQVEAGIYNQFKQVCISHWRVITASFQAIRQSIWG